MVTDYDVDRRWVRIFLLRWTLGGAEAETREIWSLNSQDSYNDPGNPVMKTLPTGLRVIAEVGGSILLTGNGASPQGDHPFLDEFTLDDKTSERLFRCLRSARSPSAASPASAKTVLISRSPSTFRPAI